MAVLPHKKIIIFDLDGTLAVSKQALDTEMVELIKKLLDTYYVSVISGGFFEQYQKQFLGSLDATDEEKKKLILLPTSGTTMYQYEEGSWKEIYCNEIEASERERITAKLNEAIDHFNLRPETQFGELIEDRRTQITYSGLGQLASPEAKNVWDPNKEKRKQVVEYIKNDLQDYSMGMGGMTSIDITRPGIDKAYGIKKIEEHFHISIEEMVFVGDALQPGGNDYPARSTGVDCVEVKDPEDTKVYIRSII